MLFFVVVDVQAKVEAITHTHMNINLMAFMLMLGLSGIRQRMTYNSWVFLMVKLWEAGRKKYSIDTYLWSKCKAHFQDLIIFLACGL